MCLCVRAIEQQQEKRELMRHYIAEDEKMRVEYRERERERAVAEEPLDRVRRLMLSHCVCVCVRAIEQQQEKRELMRHYIAEDEKMRTEYRERERERAAAEEQRIAAFAREQSQRDEERRAVKSAQNEYRERLQQEVCRTTTALCCGHYFQFCQK